MNPWTRPVLIASPFLGQRLFVVPELSLAVVITAGAYNDPSIGHYVNRLFEDIVQTLTSGSGI